MSGTCLLMHFITSDNVNVYVWKVYPESIRIGFTYFFYKKNQLIYLCMYVFIYNNIKHNVYLLGVRVRWGLCCLRERSCVKQAGPAHWKDQKVIMRIRVHLHLLCRKNCIRFFLFACEQPKSKQQSYGRIMDLLRFTKSQINR